MTKVTVCIFIFALAGCDDSSPTVTEQHKEKYISNEPGAWPYCPDNTISCRNLHNVHERPEQEDSEYQVSPVIYFLNNENYQAQAISLPGVSANFSSLVSSEGKIYAVGGPTLTIVQSGRDVSNPWQVQKYSRFADSFRDITVAGSKPERLFTTGSKGDIFRTQNSGKTWEPFNMAFWVEPSIPDNEQLNERQSRLAPYSFEGESYGIAFANDNVAVVVGEANILRSVDGGQSWQPATTRLSSRTALQGVTFVSDKQGWVVGSGGLIMFTKDGGDNWETVPLDTQQTHFMSVSFSDINHGCIAGGKGRVWCTTDGGTNWQQGNVSSKSDSMITRIQLLNELDGWMVNHTGHIYRTQDGGLHWSLWMDIAAASAGKITSVNLWGMTFDEQHGWAAGTVKFPKDKANSNSMSLTSSPVIITWDLPATKN
ncbi:WD40/YVTN/BNR-like repeat-containing protein [Budvicia aquatica]|nr:YCF48-related protein [Budvicia aquatica]